MVSGTNTSSKGTKITLSSAAVLMFTFFRVGHTAKLTIREELPNGTIASTVAEQQLSGPLMIFNLEKDKSKIFVGGFPSKYAMQNDVRDFNAFQGEVEDVVVGNTPVSLWNFVDGFNNNNGSVER